MAIIKNMDNQISPTPPIPSVPLVPPDKPTPWLKISLIIVGVLVVLGLFGNLYLLARNQKPTAGTTPTPTPTAATTPDETANWKTYTNNDFKFSFLYPSDVTIKEGFDLDVSSWHLATPVYQVILTKQGKSYFTIEASKSYSSSELGFDMGIPPTGQKAIGNTTWEEYFRPNNYGEGPFIPPDYALKKENNSVLYGIRFSGQKETNDEQNQILSTFQFLN